MLLLLDNYFSVSNVPLETNDLLKSVLNLKHFIERLSRQDTVQHPQTDDKQLLIMKVLLKSFGPVVLSPA